MDVPRAGVVGGGSYGGDHGHAGAFGYNLVTQSWQTVD